MKKIRKILKRLLIALVISFILLLAVGIVWFFSNRVLIPASADSAQHDVQVAANVDTQIVQSVSERLGQLRRESSHPAVSACIAKNGVILWAEAQGYADISRNQLATLKSKFPIGSVSKPLTATAAMCLVEQGKLFLDKDVRDYVPNFPPKKYTITARQLLSHQAGVRHYKMNWRPPLFTEMNLNINYETVSECLKLFDNDPLAFEPDSSFQYTTYGYTLLSAVMEKAAGEPFLDYMQATLFDPLEMRDTEADDPRTAHPDRTTDYITVSENAVLLSPPTNSSNKSGGGCFRSTPQDIVRFGIALLDDKIVETTSRALMFEPRKTSDGKLNKQSYGLGWRVGAMQKTESSEPIRIIHHGGTSIGAQCILLLVPEEEIVVAICANSYTGGSGELLNAAASIALEFSEDGE